MRITNKHGPVGNIGIVGGKEGKEGEREGGREGGRKGGREEGIECTDTQNYQGNTRHHVMYNVMQGIRVCMFAKLSSFFYFSSYQYLQVGAKNKSLSNLRIFAGTATQTRERII